VDSFAEIAQSLNHLLKGDPDSKDSVAFTEEQKEVFGKLKLAMSSVPAFGIPDSGQPFTLFVAEKNGYMTSVLTRPWRLPETCRLLLEETGWGWDGVPL
jgi:hypothetical protein